MAQALIIGSGHNGLTSIIEIIGTEAAFKGRSYGEWRDAHAVAEGLGGPGQRADDKSQPGEQTGDGDAEVERHRRAPERDHLDEGDQEGAGQRPAER